MKKSDVNGQTYIRPQGQTRYPLARDALRRLAEQAGAVRKIGKVVFFNTTLIDEFIEKNCREE